MLSRVRCLCGISARGGGCSNNAKVGSRSTKLPFEGYLIFVHHQEFMKKVLSILAAGIMVCNVVSAQVRVAPLDIKERTLANGMHVVTLQDNSSPTVAIHVWYNVGSKNDPPSRNGFAHLFEHIMFKSTKNMKSEQMDRLTEDVGGNNNASTWDDFTQYYELVPSNYLETLL